MTLEDKVKEALEQVFDPEIPVNIIELGLVYKIEDVGDGIIEIKMTLTAPNCPVAGDIIFDAKSKVEAVDGVKEANIHLTFDPPWTKDRMSEEAKLELGFI